MPRTNSRKRNNHRNDNRNRGNDGTNRGSENTNRVSVASSLSPNAPEFVPLTLTNDGTTTIQRECSLIVPLMLNGISSTSNGNTNISISNNLSATVTTSSKPVYSENVGQRDLLINLLNTAKVDCVICYETTKNIEPIWNCRNCFQIMHLKCIMVWYLKSHSNATWRCPACQNQVIGKPTYFCFCGTLPNPYSNNVDIPHSCGQVCGLIKKNSNAQYNDCHHKCTLLCHPGPCPPCVVQVSRKCGCGKTQRYAHCGQSDPIVCQNICSKELSCKNHVCEKQCHVNQCEPCKNSCPQIDQNVQIEPYAPVILRRSNPLNSFEANIVTEEELRLLGINPEDVRNQRNDNEDDDLMDAIEDDDDDDYDYDSNGSLISDGSADFGMFGGIDDIFDEDDEEGSDAYDDDYEGDGSNVGVVIDLLRTQRARSSANLNLRLIQLLAGHYNSSDDGDSSSSSFNLSVSHGDVGESEVRNNSVEDESNDYQASSSSNFIEEGSDMDISSAMGESDFSGHSSSWSDCSSSNALESSLSSNSDSEDSSIISQSSISSVGNSVSSSSASDTSSSSI